MHVEWLLLACAIFLSWGLIGSGIVDQLGRHYNATRRWLLAPVAGLAITALLATLLNKLGLPVKSFGLQLLAALLAINAIYWTIHRPQIAWRKAGLWAAVFVPVVMLAGWPLMVAGTDWVGTGNGDMTVYILGANHFFEHGFYQLPPLHQLLSDVDPSWDASFQYSLGEVRSGGQMILALLMTVSHLSAAQGFMVLIAALYLVIVSTAAALVQGNRNRDGTALLAVLVIGSSANLMLGAFIQLLAQAIGLAALAACCAILLDRPPTGAAGYRQATLGGLFIALVLIGYPEVSPFIGLAVLAYSVIALLKRELAPRGWLLFLTSSGASALVFANVTSTGAIHFLIWNLKYASHIKSDTTALFPAYLTPLGLAQGWGFITQGGEDMTSWHVQAFALVGGLLFIAALIRTVRDAWRLEGAAVMGAIMLLFFLPLFVTHNGFGLYKLAMYAQPFVLGALTIALWDTLAASRSPRFRAGVAFAAVAIIFVSLNVATGVQYGAATLDRVGIMTELPEWSNAHVISQLRALPKPDRNITILSTAADRVVGRFEAANPTGNSMLFFAPFLGPYVLNQDLNLPDAWPVPLRNAGFKGALTTEILAHNKYYRRLVLFTSHDASGRPWVEKFGLDPRLERAAREPRHTQLLESFNATLFNSWRTPGQYSSTVQLRPYGSVHDFLVYVPSLDAAYSARPSAIFRFEPDIFDRSKSMAGIGRSILFHIVNPSKKVRVVLNFSSTLVNEDAKGIPPAIVLGAQTVRFSVVGHGAARLFSPLVTPRTIAGLPFIALDMGRDGTTFRDRRRGIMKLFGDKYPLDSRKLVGFVRDVSIVADAEYRSLRAPQMVSDFPKGLEDPSLEFSGFYEDGWVADRAVAWLSAPRKKGCTLVLRAMIPGEAFANVLEARLTFDGKVISSTYPAPGKLVMQAPVACDGRRHEAGIAAGPVFRLPGDDGRPATMHVTSFGFE